MRGRAQGKKQRLQPKASDVADAEGVVLLFPDSLPTSVLIPKVHVGGKARFASQHFEHIPNTLQGEALSPIK